MKSDNVKSGMQQAPHRSLFNALGFTEEEMKTFKDSIVEKIQSERDKFHSTIEQKIDKIKAKVQE